jgi:hypothetical protein
MVRDGGNITRLASMLAPVPNAVNKSIRGTSNTIHVCAHINSVQQDLDESAFLKIRRRQRFRYGVHDLGRSAVDVMPTGNCERKRLQQPSYKHGRVEPQAGKAQPVHVT